MLWTLTWNDLCMTLIYHTFHSVSTKLNEMWAQKWKKIKLCTRAKKQQKNNNSSLSVLHSVTSTNVSSLVSSPKPCMPRGNCTGSKRWAFSHYHDFAPHGLKSKSGDGTKPSIGHWLCTNVCSYLSLNGLTAPSCFKIYSDPPWLPRLFVSPTSKAFLLNSSCNPTALLTQEIAQPCVKPHLFCKSTMTEDNGAFPMSIYL